MVVVIYIINKMPRFLWELSFGQMKESSYVEIVNLEMFLWRKDSNNMFCFSFRKYLCFAEPNGL